MWSIARATTSILERLLIVVAKAKPSVRLAMSLIVSVLLVRLRNKMRQLTKNEIDDLEFDAGLMGFRVVYLPKPLDWNHFVLYYLKPELTYVGHYRGLNEVKLGMQKHYRPEYSK
jgi:hypothetical protein